MQNISFEDINKIKDMITREGLSIFDGHIAKNGDVIFNGDPDEVIKNYIDFLKFINKGYTFLEIINVTEKDLQDNLINTNNISVTEYGSTYIKILKQVDKYNKAMLNLPIDTLAGYKLFVYHENVLYSFIQYSEWFETFVKDPEDELENILSMFEDELEDVEAQRYEEQKKEKENIKRAADIEKDKLKEEVESMLLDEIRFRMCTNRKARYAFVERFLREKDLLEKVCPTRRELEELSELAWSNRNNKKISLEE